MLANNIIYIDIYINKINEIKRFPLEEVVERVVLNQIKEDFHFEMIKAQAIVARTQLVKLMRKFDGAGCSNHEDCDICDSEHCIKLEEADKLKEHWKEKYDDIVEKVKKAVKETESLIITYDNKPIEARFHDTCGGATENSENIISRKIVYLRRVLCDYCTNSPNWNNIKTFSLTEIEKKLNIKFPDLNSKLNTSVENFFDDIKRDEFGRVISIKVGGKEFKGSEMTELLGLDSAKFSFSPSVITFITRGKGDGLGLCQYGGNQMALLGKGYEDILNYYYTGIEIRKLEKPCIEKPLKGRIIMLDPAHGGGSSHDYVGINGTREKDVVLKISNKLKNSLESLGAKVFTTRDKDEYIPLSKRAQLANEIRPDFFISLHLNGYTNPTIHGCEIYHYRRDKKSKRLGELIMKSLTGDGEITDRGIKIADFYLLREVNISSLHLEIDYITNPKVERKLEDETYIDKIVSRMTDGIIEYYS